MAAEAEAAREARAKVIAAEGEHKASRALRHAAEVIVDSPAALQVQYSTVQYSTVQLHYRYIHRQVAELSWRGAMQNCKCRMKNVRRKN